MVEFALVAPLAIMVALAVAQFALFLYERNVVMGSLSEGARVAATSGRTIADGQRAANNLLQEALGGRIAARVPVRGAMENGLVVLRADATLPSFVPALPGLEVHMTAAMHKEEDLGLLVATRVRAPRAGAAAQDGSLGGGPAAGASASGGPAGGRSAPGVSLGGGPAAGASASGGAAAGRSAPGAASGLDGVGG